MLNKYWTLIKQFTCYPLKIQLPKVVIKAWKIIGKLLYIPFYKNKWICLNWWIKCMTDYYFPTTYIVPLLSVDDQASPQAIYSTGNMSRKNLLNVPEGAAY